MFDPDALSDEDSRPPRYYWALLAWVALMCLIFGLTAYVMFEV